MAGPDEVLFVLMMIMMMMMVEERFGWKRVDAVVYLNPW